MFYKYTSLTRVQIVNEYYIPDTYKETIKHDTKDLGFNKLK